MAGNNFLGRSDYPGTLDVAPHDWWSDGETEFAVCRPHSSLSRR